jgi:cyclophilin family peptidyl-prolyl cis-trans isomerase
LRSHAERALRAFGEQGRRCERKAGPALPPEELEKLAGPNPVRLKFESDAGELSIDLDPALAPVAVTRMVELAQAGFFDGMSVHRVVPGFVVQFGDPGGDGYGGVERRALRSELGPGSFEPGSVGVALSGPDTGSSQIFVTLGSYPHLDGEYTRIGSAGPGWERVVQGDRLKRVRRVPGR